MRSTMTRPILPVGCFAIPLSSFIPSSTSSATPRVAVGAKVAAFAPGDEVFGDADGSFAEFVLGNERNLVRRPEGVGVSAAAAVPIAGLTALQALRDKGDRHGVVTLQLDGVNQRAETVMACEFSLLVRRERLLVPTAAQVGGKAR